MLRTYTKAEFEEKAERFNKEFWCPLTNDKCVTFKCSYFICVVRVDPDEKEQGVPPSLVATCPMIHQLYDFINKVLIPREYEIVRITDAPQYVAHEMI